jgi:hypothetical protein
MIKDFNNFKNKNLKHSLRSIKEEYYYASNDDISWWRVLEDSPIPNTKSTITKEETKSNDKYVPLIEEIQDYMGSVIRHTGYNGVPHGTWDSLTSKSIENWKNGFKNFNWEGGNGGDVICKSFYKTLVFGSKTELTLLDRCIQDVSQRPKILQEAWEKDGDSKGWNRWANGYAKSWVDDMSDFHKLCKINWSGVNSFKRYEELGINIDFLNKICPGQIESIYLKIPGKKKLDGKPFQVNFLMLIEVLNHVRYLDINVIQKAFT